ncbi:hypothetical protein ABZS44_26080 [Micromonospora sediminicola]|uniref:hypothetical protein n=1 Tax=Micromonospora sediminicola TaxID=946078 RepID=UPI0033B9C0B8
MGLDAFVYCRCWQDGLTTPCPVGPVGYDEEGRLTLLPTDGYDAAAENVFYAWMAENACPHRHMELVSEGLANWTGVRMFQQALRAAGADRFPTLVAGLPDGNDGGLTVAQAATALVELDAFRESRIADETALVDEATGEVVMQYIEDYHGVFMHGSGWHAGVDPAGFFVVDTVAQPPSTLFRATRFTQRVLPDGRVGLVGDDGTRATVAMRAVGEHGSPAPERLAVRTGPRRADDYAYLVEPLRRLCAASVATGNPVMWC